MLLRAQQLLHWTRSPVEASDLRQDGHSSVGFEDEDRVLREIEMSKVPTGMMPAHSKIDFVQGNAHHDTIQNEQHIEVSDSPVIPGPEPPLKTNINQLYNEARYVDRNYVSNLVSNQGSSDREFGGSDDAIKNSKTSVDAEPKIKYAFEVNSTMIDSSSFSHSRPEMASHHMNREMPPMFHGSLILHDPTFEMGHDSLLADRSINFEGSRPWYNSNVPDDSYLEGQTSLLDGGHVMPVIVENTRSDKFLEKHETRDISTTGGHLKSTESTFEEVTLKLNLQQERIDSKQQGRIEDMNQSIVSIPQERINVNQLEVSGPQRRIPMDQSVDNVSMRRIDANQSSESMPHGWMNQSDNGDENTNNNNSSRRTGSCSDASSNSIGSERLNWEAIFRSYHAPHNDVSQLCPAPPRNFMEDRYGTNTDKVALVDPRLKTVDTRRDSSHCAYDRVDDKV